MTDANGWYTRKKRKRADEEGGSGDSSLTQPPQEAFGASITTTANAASSSSALSLLSSASTSANNTMNGNIPASLMPHLGWTKISSACHSRTRTKKKRSNVNSVWDDDEEVQKVAGRTIFFVHDPRPTNDEPESDNYYNKDESKIWFQGRFFPCGNRAIIGQQQPSSLRTPSSVSPTSVALASSPGRMFSSSSNGNNSRNININNAWGLLAVQNEIIDECLMCSEGGYRELDLTFVRTQQHRQQQQTQQLFATTNNNNQRMDPQTNKKKKLRWVAQDVIWTGGNMMTLTSSSSSTSSDNDKQNGGGVKFVPEKLLEGRKAMEVASRYFPAMVKRLRIHRLTNRDYCDDDDGIVNGVDNEEEKDIWDNVMVVIGDMEVTAPKSFVNLGNGGSNGRGSGYQVEEGDLNYDGLWND